MSNMVLNLDKNRIARCFRRSMHTYDKAAEVQNRLVDRLVQLLDSVPDAAFDSVLEIGCCTGTLTEKICSTKPVQRIYCNDLVPEFEELLQTRFSPESATRLISYFGDIEKLTLPPNISLVLSGATFQWLCDLPAFFQRLGAELNSGSWLAFSLFTPDTLKEFSTITNVELEYMADDELKNLFKNDFDLIQYQSFQDTLFFPSVRAILSHIRDTGVGGVSEYKWSKKTLQSFEKQYTERFSSASGIPVSYSSSCYLLQRR
jgi:malonyl-CoA O-methyltransferase